MKPRGNLKTHNSLRKIVLFSAIFLVLSPTSAHALDKDSFFYFLDGQFLGGYSKVEGKDGNFSALTNWSLSPNLTLIKDTLTWINLYSGSYDRITQVTSQEEGGQSTESTQSHTLTTALKYNINKDWFLRPLFFAGWNYTQETKDESFGNGLYDYRDIGGGIESTWVTRAVKTGADQAIAGFRYFHRHYTNYVSLLSQFDPRAQVAEEHEKDFDGYKFNFAYESKNFADFSWGAEAITLFKDFDDKRTIDSNGIRSADETRQDYLNYLNLYISHPISNEWRWRLDGQGGLNLSNLDFYDTHNTVGLTDDSFISDYFDYFSFTAKPSLIYEKELAKGRRLVGVLSYAFTSQRYTGRKVQNAGGVYQDDEEQDYFHTFSAQISYPLTQYVSWVTQASYTMADSNQQYEAYYLYTYDQWNAVTGVSFKY